MELFCGICDELIPSFPLRGLIFCKKCGTDFHRDCISLKKERIFGFRQRDLNCPICANKGNSKMRGISENEKMKNELLELMNDVENHILRLENKISENKQKIPNEIIKEFSSNFAEIRSNIIQISGNLEKGEELNEKGKQSLIKFKASFEESKNLMQAFEQAIDSL